MIKEKGPWKIYKDKKNYGLVSDDFTHDVILWIDGDFRDNKQQRVYANEIAKRLNLYEKLVKLTKHRLLVEK